MPVYPYKIVHIQLNHQEIFIPPSDRCGYYFVFWRNEIPVGDWYVSKGELYNEEMFKKKIEEGTKARLDEYQSARLNKYQHSLENLPGSVDISVVICTRNRTADLAVCLDHLQQQKCKPAEIIVVDNAPGDNSTEQLVQNYNGVTYCREPRPGLDIARNTGARIASSPVIAYTDDDVEAHPLWLFHVNESFKDPQVSAMTGLVIAAELETESQQIFEKYWSFNRGYTDRYYTPEFFNKHLRTGPPVWEIGAGANMAFRKKIFEEAGYFDERLDVGAAGCNGDSEMWFRILAHGGTIHYNPRAVTFHKHRKELKQLKKQLFYYMRGFAAAALIQQQHDKRVNYKKHLYGNLPKYYLKKLLRHFPTYPFRYQTLFREMGGLLSGILYYRKHKHAKS